MRASVETSFFFSFFIPSLNHRRGYFYTGKKAIVYDTQKLTSVFRLRYRIVVVRHDIDVCLWNIRMNFPTLLGGKSKRKIVGEKKNWYTSFWIKRRNQLSAITQKLTLRCGVEMTLLREKNSLQ